MVQPCVLVRAGAAGEGETGVTYAAGVGARTTGATSLCLELASLAPGVRGRAHRHDGHESAAYVLSGAFTLWFGERLEQRVVARAGDFLFIPAGTPHLPANESGDEPAVAVLARSDPDEQESATPLPELDHLPHLLGEATR